MGEREDISAHPVFDAMSCQSHAILESCVVNSLITAQMESGAVWGSS